MLLANLKFITPRMIKNKQFYHSDGKLYYHRCVYTEDNVYVTILDTDTGETRQVTYKDLLEHPIRPFKRGKTFDGWDVLIIDNPYSYEEIQGNVIRINNLAFYPVGKHFLLWYDGKIYYNILMDEPVDVSGFRTWHKNVAYYVWNNVSMLFVQTTYFIPEVDKHIEVGIATIEEFSNKAPLYVTKMQMMGYSF